jgi:hypothetical protein
MNWQKKVEEVEWKQPKGVLQNMGKVEKNYTLVWSKIDQQEKE